MLVYHINHLDEHDLAKEMMHEQEANKWPGLVDEVEELCDSMNLQDPRKTQKGRKEYSKAVKEACRWMDEAKMKREMEKLKNKK